MRRARRLISLLALASLPAQAQFGKTITVEAGTPEDKALSAIYAASDPTQKIVLLDKFVAQYGKGDLALLADELYVEAYLARKDYARAYEHGDRVLQLDPNNITVAAELARAAQEQGDLAKEFAYGERVGAILARVAAEPAPAGTAAADWESEKANALAKVRSDVEYTEQLLYFTAANLQAPNQKAAMLERFVVAFPDSRYASNAELMAAGTYRQAGEATKMLDFAHRRLAQNPNDIAMHLVLADYLSQNGKNLREAEASAKKALDLLAAAKKPEAAADADWQKEISVEKGLAYSALGQVYVTEGRNAAAVEAFTQATPLLESNAVNYARNQYRLGFTLAKMRRFAEARKALGQAASLDTPYKRLALDELSKLPSGRPPRR
jgi:tetratricopeptide (TPR) repeat protein